MYSCLEGESELVEYLELGPVCTELSLIPLLHCE
jgi:hypothetical protein